jgi:4-amino-4-deoxy-L-arabinose transferase-like glycosyltransferase
VGFYGSDDLSYAEGGLGWLHHFPYVGDSHWTLRHTLVIPMAALFGLFGISEITLVLPAFLYYLALLVLVFVMLQRHFDTVTGCVAVLILGTLPLTAVAASTVVPDFAEVFFCLLSLALFFEATRRERRGNLLLLAGVAAGFGWLTRETVVFFLLSYGLLFLAATECPGGNIS